MSLNKYLFIFLFSTTILVSISDLKCPSNSLSLARVFGDDEVDSVGGFCGCSFEANDVRLVLCPFYLPDCYAVWGSAYRQYLSQYAVSRSQQIMAWTSRPPEPKWSVIVMAKPTKAEKLMFNIWWVLTVFKYVSQSLPATLIKTRHFLEHHNALFWLHLISTNLFSPVPIGCWVKSWKS